MADVSGDEEFLRHRLNTLETRCSTVQKQFDESSRSRLIVQEEVSSLLQENAEIKQQLIAANELLSTPFISEDDLQEINTARLADKNTIEALRHQVEELTNELKMSEEKCQVLEEKLSRTTEENIRLKSQLREMELEIKCVNLQLQTLTKEMKESEERCRLQVEDEAKTRNTHRRGEVLQQIKKQVRDPNCFKKIKAHLTLVNIEMSVYLNDLILEDQSHEELAEKFLNKFPRYLPYTAKKTAVLAEIQNRIVPANFATVTVRLDADCGPSTPDFEFQEALEKNLAADLNSAETAQAFLGTYPQLYRPYNAKITELTKYLNKTLREKFPTFASALLKDSTLLVLLNDLVNANPSHSNFTIAQKMCLQYPHFKPTRRWFSWFRSEQL